MFRFNRSFNLGLRIVLFASFIFSIPGTGSSDVLAAHIWCNPSNSGMADGLSKNTGYKTLWEAMKTMSQGDTVIIADGDWGKTSGMSIDNPGHLPPSGLSYAEMSVIRAETDWNVKIPHIKDHGTGREYVKIQGVVVKNEFSALYGWRHSKVLRCAFMGKKVGGNVATFSISKGKYILVEECIAWGGGRYKFLDYKGSHNIFRRCVARHDWYVSPDWPGQESNFRGYGCHDSAWQNCLSVDSDRKAFQETNSKEDSDFWIGDQSGAGGNIINGCVVLKGMYQAFYLGGTTASDTIEVINSAALGPSLEGAKFATGAITFGIVKASISNCLFYNFSRGNQHFISHNKGQGNLMLMDSIATDVGKIVIKPDVSADYNLFFNTASNNFGKHTADIDPFKSGLRYPTRVESGSKLATLGYDGHPCGPTILKKIGISGTCKDEKGWDKVTDENLWPFPYEDKIGELMRKTVDGVSGIYGFCEDGQTLTNYIWGYLGNTVPPFNVSSIPGDGRATLKWDPPAEITIDSITGFNVYKLVGQAKTLVGGTVVGNTNCSKIISGLRNGSTYEFAVATIGKVKGESGISYTVRTTPGKSVPPPAGKSSPAMMVQKGKKAKNTKETTRKEFSNKLGMQFVLILPGTFTMGILSDEPETKPHQVTLTKSFYIQKSEVTQGQWKRIMGRNPSFFKECGDDCPVEQVSWNEVQQFIKRLNQLEGTRKYRLPTEAEWEYACRAGTKTPFSFEKCLTTEQANYNGNYPFVGCQKGLYRKKPISVKTFSSNTWGLTGMHGNVWEWCQDWLGDYSEDTMTDPLGPPTGSSRVIRGGGWNSYANACRSGNRSGSEPAKLFANLGFRVVKDL
jgi:formylglycine-generating enzyme required for sulfatase activity